VKIIKRSIFFGVGAIAFIICIVWYNREKQFHLEQQNKISVYKCLDSLVGKIITAPCLDSLLKWSTTFNHEFYESQIIPPEDTSTLLAMRRFSFELRDKLNGMINIADPARFANCGTDIIQACQSQISNITDESKEFAKNQ
jgi:hypothetical protein